MSERWHRFWGLFRGFFWHIWIRKNPFRWYRYRVIYRWARYSLDRKTQEEILSNGFRSLP